MLSEDGCAGRAFFSASYTLWAQSIGDWHRLKKGGGVLLQDSVGKMRLIH